MKRFRAILTLVLVFTAVAAVHAADLIPVPDFMNHEIPQTQNPTPRSEWFERLDLAALVVGLALASYFALKSRSRRGLLLLAVASVAWLGFWRKGCVCPIGSIQNVALALFDRTYAIPATVAALFTLPLIFTLFFGRTFCAAVCPLGAVQELVALRPIRVPTWIDHTLGLVAYIYLGAGVLFAGTGTALVICRYDPFVGLFRMSASVEMLIVAAAFLLVGLFVGRPYCRYVCPYGALLGLVSRVSRRRLRIPPTDCIQCRLCEDACPYGAIRPPTVTPASANRRQNRLRLAVMLALLPALVALGAWLGRRLETPLAKAHPTVQLAERVRLEDSHQVTGVTDASEAFRNTGRPAGDLYAEALLTAQRIGVAGGWFGAWVGLVLGVKLVQLSIRRRRTDYEPDPARCVSCGRCFWYCPSEQARQGWIQAAPAAKDDAT